MTAKAQLNARVSVATRQRLDELTTVYGTQAEALAVAIDRLHVATFPAQVPPPPKINQRDMELIHIAMRHGIDSDELDLIAQELALIRRPLRWMRSNGRFEIDKPGGPVPRQETCQTEGVR